jgi:hypothetical protein
VNELALDNEGAGAHNTGGVIEDAEQEVLIVAVRYPFVAIIPLLKRSHGVSFVAYCTRAEEGRELEEDSGGGHTCSVTSPTVVNTLSTSRKPLW